MYVDRFFIRQWLENYHSLTSIKTTARYSQDSGISTNGPYDGVGFGRLTKIMLDQAIEKLPPELKGSLVARYIYEMPSREAVAALGISKKQYYRRFVKAEEAICNIINQGLHTEIVFEDDEAQMD